MPRLPRLPLLFLALALPACVALANGPRPAPGALPPEGADTCAAATAALAEAPAGGPPLRSRVHGPGDAVTMDYLPQRLNAVLDATGHVAELRCG